MRQTSNQTIFEIDKFWYRQTSKFQTSNKKNSEVDTLKRSKFRYKKLQKNKLCKRQKLKQTNFEQDKPQNRNTS